MSIVYPKQSIESFDLEMSLSYKMLNLKYGFDFGERYHLDVACRAKIGMEIDRAVFKDFGKIGLGFPNPVPRISIAPFGHRFVDAMYGCECKYASDAEPELQTACSIDTNAMLQPWNADRFERAQPVRTIISQMAHLRELYAAYPVTYGSLPHLRYMSSQQNLGSVINNAFSLIGERLFLYYINAPEFVHACYRNITDLMLLSMEVFQKIDGWPLKEVFLSNYTVSMISPDQYMKINYPYDRRIMGYAKYIGAKFMIHQDSGVNAHLANYAHFDYLDSLDLGRDANFEQVATLFPKVKVNCILYPSWLQDASAEDIDEELTRLIMVGKRFKSFSFSLSDIDFETSREKIFRFYEILTKCVRDS